MCRKAWGFKSPPAHLRNRRKAVPFLWILLIQPFLRIRLNAINPHFPVQMRAVDPPGGANDADDLPGGHMIANMDQDLFLMIVTGVNTPTMVDEGGIAAYSECAGVDHNPICSGMDIEVGTYAIIQAGMEVDIIAVVVRTPVAITRI